MIDANHFTMDVDIMWLLYYRKLQMSFTDSKEFPEILDEFHSGRSTSIGALPILPRVPFVPGSAPTTDQSYQLTAYPDRSSVQAQRSVQFDPDSRRNTGQSFSSNPRSHRCRTNCATDCNAQRSARSWANCVNFLLIFFFFIFKPILYLP